MTDAEIQQFQTDKQRKLNQARCGGGSYNMAIHPENDWGQLIQTRMSCQKRGYIIIIYHDTSEKMGGLEFVPFMISLATQKDSKRSIHVMQVPIVFALRLSQAAKGLSAAAGGLPTSKMGWKIDTLRYTQDMLDILVGYDSK